MIAALYVQKNGHYFGLPNVDPWDEARDARLYAGPWPVVAHPPCSRWCMLASVVEARHAHLRGKYKAQDGGCFAAALLAVRTWGGVLEHPAYSAAWRAHGLLDPRAGWGWTRGDYIGGWTCEVAQSGYGHRARKRTWLYSCGVSDLPSLDWRDGKSSVWMTWLERDGRGKQQTAPSVERMGKCERNQTPLAFRDVLISIAESANAKAAE